MQPFQLVNPPAQALPPMVRRAGCAPVPVPRMLPIRENGHGPSYAAGRMRLDAKVASFGHHESFPLRFGWITKGLRALAANPGVFGRQDATVILGVGKNMVSAIKYWLHATGLAESSGRNLAPTKLADVAFGEHGDPYLEDDATIWLLHWLLATTPARATAIYWFFNHFHKPTFTSAEASAGLSDFAKQELTVRTAATTLKRDVQLVLRMYARTSGGTRLTLEDALDSPLAMLNLQERLDARHWRSVPMDRAELPLHVLAFAVAQLFEYRADSANATRQDRASQLAMQDLMYSSKSHCAPGAVFRLTEEGLVQKLEALCDAFPETLSLSRTAGVFQLYKRGPLDAVSLLETHYSGSDGRDAA